MSASGLIDGRANLFSRFNDPEPPTVPNSSCSTGEIENQRGRIFQGMKGGCDQNHNHSFRQAQGASRKPLNLQSQNSTSKNWRDLTPNKPAVNSSSYSSSPNSQLKSSPNAIKNLVDKNDWESIEEALLKDSMNMIAIATLLHKVGRNKLLLSPQRCALIEQAIRNRPSQDMVTPQTLSMLLYGLQSMTDSDAVSGILFMLIEKIKNCQEPFKPQEISMSLYGLQNMGESDVVNGILSVLIEKIEECQESFTAYQISMSLYGLQNMTGRDVVQGILSVLKAKIESCQDSFNPQEISMSLYGLQNMGKSDVVSGILSVLKAKIERCQKPFKPQEISMSLYALQNMTESGVVCGILSVLKEKIEICEELFTAQNISMSVYGLQNMGKGGVVEGVLSGLIAKIVSCEEPFTPQNISMLLYGLQNMTENNAVKGILCALIAKIKSQGPFQEPFTANLVKMSLYGLQNMTESNNVKEILSVLEKVIKVMEEGSLKKKDLAEALVCLEKIGSKTQEVIRAIEARLENFKSSKSYKVEDILELLELNDTNELDLHGCSHRLAQKLVELFAKKHFIYPLSPDKEAFHNFSLKQESTVSRQGSVEGKNCVGITIIFGKSSHNKSNEGKMKGAVQQGLQRASVRACCNWGEGHVTLT